MKKRQIWILLIVIFTFFLLVLIGPMDVFRHGYYCDVVNYDQIAAQDRKGNIDIKDGRFEMKFSPVKNHFAGFEINLINQPNGNTGTLKLSIYDSKGREIDVINADLSRVRATEWYKLYANKSLKKGEVYTLNISAENCKTVPYLQVVDPDYLTEENISGDILLGYAYAKSTFTFQNKVLIAIFIISIAGGGISFLLLDGRYSGRFGRIFVYMFMVAVLAWNYMYNSMDNSNDSFEFFQSDSESLVTALLAADRDNVGFGASEAGYGLGVCYYTVKGDFHNRNDLKTDDNWDNGYSRTSSAVSIASNKYTREIAVPGNYVLFANGDTFQIANVSDDQNNIIVELISGVILTEAKYGSLEDALFYSQDLQQFPKGILTPYPSQYGLQGKIFKQLARYMKYENAVDNLKLICAMAAAAVFALIVFLIAAKYNKVLAGCFFVTFWLSPWVVNFARNLYWVEFTWFIPMAVGLFCALKIKDRYCRIFSYTAAFVSITVKCLCGYEYITSVMMGLITFLLSDLVMAVMQGDKKQQKLLFRTIFILGVVALAGFVTALCIHAPLRGNGSLAAGLKNIYSWDVLVRTNGADLNYFDGGYENVVMASVWETLCKYFDSDARIIAGVDGSLFPLLCILPVLIFLDGYRKKSLNIEIVVLYIISFITSISWFALAKSHSYVHTHINFVLWYMGYVQMCIYTISDRIMKYVNREGGCNG